MKETKELLKLIEDGKAIEILSEENLIEKLNKLYEQEFIDIEGSSVVLTTKGKQAQITELDRIIKDNSKDSLITESPAPEKTGKYRKYYAIMLLLALLFLIGLLILI